MSNGKDIVTWEIWNKSQNVFVRNGFQIGKYNFNPYEQNFNPENYVAQLQKTKYHSSSLKFSISWEVDPAQKDRDEEFEKEIKLVLAFLTLQTDTPFEIGTLNYNSPSKNEGYIRAIAHPAISNIVELDKNSTTVAISKLEQMNNLSIEKKGLLIRAIEWFVRGVNESDTISSFANFWLGFEVLTYWFGKGSPWKCQKCDTILQDSSTKARGKEFLEKLNITDYDFDDLYTTRNNLFHRAEPMDPQKRIDLGYLLKKSILTCINNQSKNSR